MIEFVPYNHNGGLLYSAHDMIVCTVNCMGVMGAGIAKEFKAMYPDYYNSYKKDCKNHLIRPGTPDIYFRHPHIWPTRIVSFPTKLDWRDPSKYEWIEKGLEELAIYINTYDATSVGIPALGCGNGGLDWNLVKVLIEEDLGEVSDNHAIYVYEPESLERK